jgi:hypothetical protein
MFRGIYQKRYKCDDIYLAQLNYKSLTDYELYLKPEKENPCGHNTAIKHIHHLRKIVNMAIANDWIEKIHFSSINPLSLKLLANS